MGFSDEDRILMENVYVFEGYGAEKLIKEFLRKGKERQRKTGKVGDCGD